MAGIALLFLIGLYFLPTIVAASRHKQNTIAIGALNFFLGWSFIGWIVALIWALSADPYVYQHVVNVSQNVGVPYYPPQGVQPPPYAPVQTVERTGYPMAQRTPEQPGQVQWPYTEPQNPPGT